jgi:hypothetical protein
MLRFNLVVIALIALVQLAFAQQQKPCTHPDAQQFDFWLGEWEAVWADTAKGTNTITKVLGGCVIYEQFNGAPSSPLIGRSYSVYLPKTDEWKQTWVDNQGSYLDFTGKWYKDKMILSRKFENKGKTVMQRMVWYNISYESFDWNWERSDDEGKTWKVNWQIRYTRK